MTIDDLKNQFSDKLDKERGRHDRVVSMEILELGKELGRYAASLPPLPVQQATAKNPPPISRVTPPPLPAPVIRAEVQLTHDERFRQVDRYFLKRFNLLDHLGSDRLGYPTILCETLEEFFTPFVTRLNVSNANRGKALTALVEEASATAEESGGGGTFGVNFSDQGCYLNGWLFAFKSGKDVKDLPYDPVYLTRIMSTASHEKLGHGFINAYSALGKLNIHLDQTLASMARQFGLAEADDAETRLKHQQNALLFHVSQFLEEGWATWIEGLMREELFKKQNHPRYALGDLIDTIKALPVQEEGIPQLQEALLQGLNILFTEASVSPGAILAAIKLMAQVGDPLEDFIMHRLGQPLRYVLGELICSQAEKNLGDLCVPYAVLISANVTFDPAKMSLSDLSGLFFNDPGMHPDSRLVLLSRLKPAKRDNIRELAELATEQLNMTVPAGFRGH